MPNYLELFPYIPGHAKGAFIYTEGGLYPVAANPEVVLPTWTGFAWP